MSTAILSRERLVIAVALAAVVLTMVIIWSTFQYCLKPKQENNPVEDEDSDHLLEEEAPIPELEISDYDFSFDHHRTPVIAVKTSCQADDDSVLIANATDDESDVIANNEDEENRAAIDCLADRLVRPRLQEEREELSTMLIGLINRIDDTLEDRESIVVFQTSGLSSLRSSIAASIEQMDVK